MAKSIENSSTLRTEQPDGKKHRPQQQIALRRRSQGHWYFAGCLGAQRRLRAGNGRRKIHILLPHAPLLFSSRSFSQRIKKCIITYRAQSEQFVVSLPSCISVQAILIPDILFPALRNLSINALYGTGKTMFWGQLWFLTSLFATACTCHLLIRSRILSNKGIRTITAIILVPTGTWFLAWYPPRYPLYWITDRFYFTYLQGLPWNVDLLPITMAFYLLGTAFPKQRTWNQVTISPSRLFAIAAGSFAFVGMCVLLMDWGMDLNNRRYDHWAGSTLSAACGIGGVLLLSLAIDKLGHRWPTQALTFIGKRSLFILVLHFSLQQNSFSKMLTLGFPWSSAVIASFVIALSISVAVSLAWERIRGKVARRKTT